MDRGAAEGCWIMRGAAAMCNTEHSTIMQTDFCSTGGVGLNIIQPFAAIYLPFCDYHSFLFAVLTAHTTTHTTRWHARTRWHFQYRRMPAKRFCFRPQFLLFGETVACPCSYDFHRYSPLWEIYIFSIKNDWVFFSLHAKVF